MPVQYIMVFSTVQQQCFVSDSGQGTSTKTGTVWRKFWRDPRASHALEHMAEKRKGTNWVLVWSILALALISSGAACRVKTSKLFCLSTVASQIVGAGAEGLEVCLIACFEDELNKVVVKGELVEQAGGMSASGTFFGKR